VADLSFRAMGCSCRVLTFGGPAGVADRARRRIVELERCWSRFLSESELSRLNRSRGALTLVSREAFLLVRRAVDAWELTEGAFDPTVLPAVRQLGYDRSFEHLAAPQPSDDAPIGSGPTPGCGAIQLFEEISAVMLPADVQLDPGGIGKGLAADLVVAELLEAGVVGAAVDIGGDIRVAGTNPEADGWHVEIADPRQAGQHLATIVLDEGAVATSSTLGRAWRHDGAMVHHLIDPSTGGPIDTPLLAATVVAGEGWWAEALTKLVFVCAGSTEWPDLRGARALTVDGHGVVRDSAVEGRAA
jgi:thiamine biosynthesis lipoprotein